MPKVTRPEHRPHIQNVKAKADAEERARERAAAQVREAVLGARNETNAAIADALSRGVTKEAIRQELGVSYSTIVNRMREHEARVGYVAPAAPAARTEEAPATVPATPDGTPRVHVTKDDTGHTVTLTHFTHPDVGTDLTGQVIYDEDGDLKIADAVFDQSDPLWSDKLWATKEVQDAVERA